MTFFSIRGTMWPKTNGFQVLVCVLIYVRGRLVLREQCVKMGKVPHKKQKAKLWTGQTEYHDSKLQPTRCNVSWFISFYRRSTCFRRFLCPSSGVHNCTYSFRYCQPILLLAATMEEMERSCVLLAVISNQRNTLQFSKLLILTHLKRTIS